MKRLVYIFFIGNTQVALAQLYGIQKLDDFVWRGVNLESCGKQVEGNAIGGLKLARYYDISNKVNTILKCNTDDILNENYKKSNYAH